jgi:hypothetical protein
MRGRGACFLAVTAGLATSVVLSGCVSLPTSGLVRNVNQLPNSYGPAQQPVQLTPTPPGAQWSPKWIVRGFLAATGATWTGGPSSLRVAREYLTSSYAKTWRPSPAATVIDDAPQVAQLRNLQHVTGGSQADEVSVTSQQLETLVSANSTEAGSISVSSLPGPYVFEFDLTQVDDSWRIASISGPSIHDDNTVLLLTNSDFLSDYQPRDLYFPAVSAPNTLVPFPVYIPDQGGPLIGVQQLVAGLTSQPPPGSNWLYDSVRTAFKPGTTLSAQVTPNGSAIVNLGGKADSARPGALAEMEAQLVWTLTSSPYSAGSGIGSVELKIGGRSLLLLPRRFARWVPAPQGSQLYFQVLDRAGQPELDSIVSATALAAPGNDLAPKTEVPPDGLGHGLMTAVAVSPPSLAGPFDGPTFAACRGKTVYVAPLAGGAPVTQTLPTACTSLSWDDNGYLWVAAGTGVFRISETAGALQVVPIAIPATLPPSATFTSLRVAPDGVRVAMIIKHGNGSASVVVTSISQNGKLLVYLAQSDYFQAVGPELTDPVALCWWDADHLLVLNKQGSRSQLYEVPLNGAQPTPVPTPSGAVSVAANGSSVAVGIPGPGGLDQPVVKISPDLVGSWHRIAGASSPVYPG